MNPAIPPIPDKLSKREQIILAAFNLFKQNGFYATGVDLIMQQANVSKRTMYVYFPTKHDLIVAALEHYRADYERKLQDLLAREDMAAREKIMAIFADAANWFHDPQFHGCLAIKAMGEFAGKDDNIENACRVFKTWELAVFQQLTQALPVKYPDDLAYKLLVLLEGIGALAQVMRQPCPVDIGKMVNDLIEGESIA